MAENTLLYEIEQLPDTLKQDALNYIFYLKKEYLLPIKPKKMKKEFLVG